MKRKWLQPQLMNLSIEQTKDDAAKDWPHFVKCMKCGKHYYINAQPIITKCKCCGGTEFDNFYAGPEDHTCS